MIEELNYLDYYSSGYILDRLSYSPKESISIKSKTKYENKEEVKTAEQATGFTSSFL